MIERSINTLLEKHGISNKQLANDIKELIYEIPKDERFIKEISISLNRATDRAASAKGFRRI